MNSVRGDLMYRAFCGAIIGSAIGAAFFNWPGVVGGAWLAVFYIFVRDVA